MPLRILALQALLGILALTGYRVTRVILDQLGLLEQTARLLGQQALLGIPGMSQP